jgi:hypothetical protein
MKPRWGQVIQAVKAAAPANAPEPGAASASHDIGIRLQGSAPASAEPAAAASPPQAQPRPRMIDRRDGVARLEYVFVPGKIRGGKRSDQWGRPRNNPSREGWIGACLSVESRTALKHLALHHDLHEWQVLVEAIDLFKKTYGDKA